MSIDSAFSAGDVVKFPDVGSAVTMTVTSVEEEEREDFDGNPERVVVIHGTTDDGDVRLFCNKGQLRHAIGVAVKEATGKAGAPTAGGQLHIKRGPDGQPSKTGWAAPHSYTAKYKPGAPASTNAAFGANDEDPF